MISQQEIEGIATGVITLTAMVPGFYFIYRLERVDYQSAHLKAKLPEYLTSFRKWLAEPVIK